MRGSCAGGDGQAHPPEDRIYLPFLAFVAFFVFFAFVLRVFALAFLATLVFVVFDLRGLRVVGESKGGERSCGVNSFIGGFSMMLP